MGMKKPFTFNSTVTESEDTPEVLETTGEEGKDESMELENMNTDTKAKEPESRFEKILVKHSEEFTQELSKSFEVLVKRNPEVAASMFVSTVVAALNTYDGDVSAMADDLGINDRDIAMASYELNEKVKEGVVPGFKA